jgi:hypothetical protein
MGNAPSEDALTGAIRIFAALQMHRLAVWRMTVSIRPFFLASQHGRSVREFFS